MKGHLPVVVGIVVGMFVLGVAVGVVVGIVVGAKELVENTSYAPPCVPCSSFRQEVERGGRGMAMHMRREELNRSTTEDEQELNRRWTGVEQELNRRWTGGGQEANRTGDEQEMNRR
jgi:hypothetical protein